MDNEKTYIGIDIGEKITQIAVYSEERYEPVCVGGNDDESKNYILSEPDLNDRERCMLFVKECLSIARRYASSPEIGKVAVTLRDVDKEKADEFKDILVSLDIPAEDVTILSYRQSYMYYVLNQSRDVWVNDVGLFDYSEFGLRYTQMTVDRRKTPYIAGIIEKDYSDNLPYEAVYKEDYNINRVFMFENIVENAIHKQIISTIYMTGAGFESGWADDSMRKLCAGRRIFKGQNLYVKGACYAARHSAGLGIMPECVFIDDEMIRVHISTTVYVKAENQELIIAKAGSRWFDVDGSLYIIPDNEDELIINVTNVITREQSKHIIPLDFINDERQNMTTRLRVRIRFQDVNHCIITIKDEGFGTICGSSGRIYEKIINVG